MLIQHISWRNRPRCHVTTSKQLLSLRETVATFPTEAPTNSPTHPPDGRLFFHVFTECAALAVAMQPMMRPTLLEALLQLEEYWIVTSLRHFLPGWTNLWPVSVKLELLTDRRNKHAIKLVNSFLEGKCHPAMKALFIRDNTNRIIVSKARTKLGRNSFRREEAELFNQFITSLQH